MTAKLTSGAAPLPLADAQRRLGKPGRRRTRPLEGDRPLVGEATGRPARPPSTRSPASALPVLGPEPGDQSREQRRKQRRKQPLDIVPRLLDVEAVTRYLGGLSPRAVSNLISTGVLRRVQIPIGQGAFRRVLVDRVEVDRLIETWKDDHSGSPA